MVISLTSTSRTDHHMMPFPGLFKKRRDSAIPSSSKTPSLLRRRSTRIAVKEVRPAVPMNYNNSRLVPPSFPAPAADSSPVLTNPDGQMLDLPPTYTEALDQRSSENAPRPSNVSQASKISLTTADDPYAFLSSFDTIFLIDDSGSMAGRSWKETSHALAAIAPICAAHDNDGVEVVFMNTRQRSFHKNLKTAEQIRSVFNSTRPGGATPTGTTLNAILKPYLREVETKGCERVKPLNIIVITDGVPTDDPESVIVQAAKKLERLECPGWQVGIQFFQVGSEPGAAEALAELDDGLVEMGCPRDIVDTVPWKSELSAQSMLKVVLGAVNRRLDRRRNSGEQAR